ncbi:MAG TPA: NAD-dependent epimerase/dehydratase family protein, partial [Steroidobacteraceae bacterium]|nr:NAD-dependent epimerase/dehydratase family protein [Steroidobacteraceae bacterium]
CDAIVHLAGLAHQQASTASRLPEFLRINAEGTRLLARSASRARVRRFVFVSSIAAVRTRSDTPVDDSTPCAPTDAYGCSKLEAERALLGELKNAPTDWCILRPPLVYGPGNPGNMRRLLQLMSSGLPLPLASIRNRRSFIFVDNLVDALVRVLRHPPKVCSTYVLSDGSDFSTPELVTALAAAAGRRVRLFPVPVSVLGMLGRAGDAAGALLDKTVGLSTAVDRLVGSLPVDGTRFRQSFEWHPRINPDAALRQTARAPLGPAHTRPDSAQKST